MPTITTNLEQCAAALRAGAVVAIPTETVYGLAASIHIPAAIRRIFEIKQRPFFDPLIVHIADLAQKDEVVRDWPEPAQRLADRFWPGPMTLVLPKQSSIDPLITAGLDTVGIRWPKLSLAQDLIRAVGAPLAAPSANRFGRTSPTSARHVADEFPNEDLLILDAGPCQVGLESSVLGIESGAAGDRITTFRPGFITREMIRDAFNDWSAPVTIDRASSAASPGMLNVHYRPGVPLVIIAGLPKPLDSPLLAAIQRSLAITGTRGAELLLDANPGVAARSLYAQMRSASAHSADFLLVWKRPEQSGREWDAIWDRLERAASAHFSALRANSRREAAY